QRLFLVLLADGLLVLLIVTILLRLLLILLLGRMQLVRRLERRAGVLLQSDGEDLRRGGEERVRLAWSPRRMDERLEAAVGEEVDPLAVAAPGGTPVVVAVGRQRHRGAGLDAVEEDAVEGVRTLHRPGEPVAVGRPGEVLELAVGG